MAEEIFRARRIRANSLTPLLMQKQAWKLFPTLVHHYTEVLTAEQLATIAGA